MVKCRQCDKSKAESQYSKCSSAKNGLQPKCKSCNSKDNLKFREQINPEHHAEWQRNNVQSVYRILKKHRKADKGSIIYSIKNPDGFYYIGMTEAFLSVRRREHRLHYSRAKKGKRPPLPLLHESFDVHGIDNHKFEIVVQLDGIDRKQLKYIETSFIQSFKEINKSLNKRIN
jgi:hypothetical protein